MSDHRTPTTGDAGFHYWAAKDWLQRAEETGKGYTADQTTAMAALATAHAALGTLAWDIATGTLHKRVESVRLVSGRRSTPDPTP